MQGRAGGGRTGQEEAEQGSETAWRGSFLGLLLSSVGNFGETAFRETQVDF